jgi:hypothetical protein
MSEYLIPILVMAGLAAVVLIILYLRKKKRSDEAWKESTFARTIALMKRVTPVVTPGGVELYYEEGVTRNIDMASVDEGREVVFRKLECAGYVVNRGQHSAKICIFNSELSPESRTPSFRVFIAPGNPYYGGPYDMAPCPGQECDHYVLAAGEMVAAGEPYGDVLAIPHPQGDNAFLKTIVDYETEHIGYAWYDGDKFEETKIHGSGLGHPIIAPCPDEAGRFSSSTVNMDVVCDGGTILVK